MAKYDIATTPQSTLESVNKKYHIPMSELVKGEKAEKFAFETFTDYLFANTKMTFYENVLAKSKRISKTISETISSSPPIIVELIQGRNLILKEMFPTKQAFLDYHTTIFDAEDYTSAHMLISALGGIQKAGTTDKLSIQDSVGVQDSLEILSALPNTNALVEMSQAKREYLARRANELYSKQ